MAMTPQQKEDLAYTIAHFEEIARQNRFPENNTIRHDTERCVICRPQRLPLDPFVTYLEVITRSIAVRRPRLDQTLVDEINSDLELVGSASRVSLAALRAGDDHAVELWSNWLRTAMETGLQLLAIHSAESIEFDLDEAEANGWRSAVNAKIQELMDYQRLNA